MSGIYSSNQYIESFINNVNTQLNAKPDKEGYDNAIRRLQSELPNYPTHERLLRTLCVLCVNRAVSFGDLKQLDSVKSRYEDLKYAIDNYPNPTLKELDHAKKNLAILVKELCVLSNNTNQEGPILNALDAARYASEQRMQRPIESADVSLRNISIPAWHAWLAFRLSRLYTTPPADLDKSLHLADEALKFCPKEEVTTKDLQPWNSTDEHMYFMDDLRAQREKVLTLKDPTRAKATAQAAAPDRKSVV